MRKGNNLWFAAGMCLFFLSGMAVWAGMPVSTTLAHTLSGAGAASSSAAATSRPRLMAGIPVDAPPVAFVSEQNTPRGLAVDLGLMLATLLKRDIRFVQDTTEGLEKRLQSGSIDFIIGLPQPQTVPDDVRIIVTPFALNRRILVATPEAHVTCEQDFQGRRLLMVEGDPYAATARKVGATVELASSSRKALERLTKGEADAYVAQSGEVASYVAQRLDLKNVRIMGLPLERVPFIMEVSKDSEELQSALVNALMQLENGGHLDLLRDKWLGRSLIQQTFWDVYQRPILTVLSGVLLVTSLGIIWIVTLRRQVRRTTRNLQNSERRYRELIEGSPDMTLLLGPDGDIRLANRIAREALDLSPYAETGSFALWDALCENGRGCLGLLLESAGQAQSMREEIILHPDGEPRIMEFIAFPTAEGRSGEPLICCIGRDMTERRRLENELVEVERLAIIGKTAASVAHEINNPLGIIMAHTDVALDEVGASMPGLRRHLEAIQRNVERAATTTRRLLNIAMPQSISREPQNLADIIKEALAFLRPRMRNVRLDISRLSETLSLRGDRILLEQLFINLFLNALESIKDEGELVVSGQEVTQNDKKLLRMEVRDSGQGIASENLERIFDPFFTTRGTKGFGLGLFISRRIVEAHKGTLYAESTLGHGAAMIVELPVEREPDSAETSPL